ncbi:hypothetical protein Tco_0444450 [Tanacetum coccineum]
MHKVQVQLVMGELKTELGMQIQENGVALDEEQWLFIAGRQDNVINEDVDEQPIQDLAPNVDNVFQADNCDDFDSDVDEAPTAQTMFMANLSSADLVYDKASSSYDLNILSEVPDHDNYQDAVCKHHEVHEMHEDVQPNYVVDSHYVFTVIMPVVQSNVSYVRNDAYMMILNDIHEQSAQYVFVTTHNNVVDKSLTAELATYKEEVELYERRAKFELTEREQKIDEQLRIVIADRNFKEENLKRELHSVKLQLTSTINHNKSMVEEVTKAAIGYKNPFYLSKAKQVQPALYFDQEIVKPNHARILFMTRGYPRIADTTKNLIKNEAEALKEQTTALKPIKALTVYPLNTPATFVPKMTTTVVQARYLELEAELSKLCDKGQKDDHTELVKCFSNLEVNHLNLQYGKDVEPIPPHNRNNKEVHLDYLKHLKESVETLHEIVKEAKVERLLDRALASACLYTKHSQELLEYVIGTCPKDFNKQDKKHASTPLTRKK